MPVFKLVGVAMRNLSMALDSEPKPTTVKQFVRALDERDVFKIAERRGITSPRVTYYGEDTNPFLSAVH